jgi:hypothetical protein
METTQKDTKTMIEVKGKSNISAKILADSVSEQGNRLTSLEIEVPRIVWSEFLTHGMLCRNAASSRAIPFDKMNEQLAGQPVRFGKANKGMCDAGEHSELINGLYTPEEWWKLAKLSAINFARGFKEAGYAKQIFNRPTEPYQQIKAVVSMTEFDNFAWLRNHEAADPTLHELARCMQEARDESVPQLLKAGEFHLPYIYIGVNKWHERAYYSDESMLQEFELTLEEAIKVSCARTAAVSFRNEDYGLEKCLEVYARLIGDERKHASAFQHQATPLNKAVYENDKYDFSVTDLNRSVNLPYEPETWQEGVSHVDKSGNLWSAQFKGWMMYRKTIKGENYVNPVV